MPIQECSGHGKKSTPSTRVELSVQSEPIETTRGKIIMIRGSKLELFEWEISLRGLFPSCHFKILKRFTQIHLLTGTYLRQLGRERHL